MPANHLSKEQRRANGLAGWQKRQAQHAAEELRKEQRAAGRLGYQAALRGGRLSKVQLAAILARRWSAFDQRVWEDAEAVRARAQARRLYPLDGVACECGCGEPATHRHHRDGTQAGNGRANIALLAAACHMDVHRAPILT
jgi:hypothetical protein